MNRKTASIQFIFATILLDALGIGIIIPILPDVIRRFGTDPDFVNHYYGYFISVYALMQFMASPILGTLADRFGRRPVLLVSLCGAGLDYILMAFAPQLWILFVGRVISGLTGASMTVASSYMADLSDDSNRAANFGMIGAAWGIGFIVGPLVGGALGVYGHEAPFLAAAALSLANFVFGVFVLPESLPSEKRRHIEFSRMNPFASLMKVLKPGPTSLLIWSFFLLFLAGNVHPSVWTLYTQYKFGWSAFQVGLSLCCVGVVTALTQAGLTRILIPKIGEVRAAHVGIWFYALGFVAFAIANQGWMMYAILILSGLAGIAPPAMQSLIAAKVPSEEQGELQGSLMSLASVTSIVGPLLYTSAFALFTGPNAVTEFSGMPYLIAAIVSLAARAILAWGRT